MVNELTISKGAFTVTLYTDNIAQEYRNKLFPITPAQGADNQAGGPRDVKIVDLLRITHTYVIKCFIAGTDSKTAKTVKDELVSIAKGGGIAGGVTTLTYDGDSIDGYIEKFNITERSEDNPSDAIRDQARYEVALTFIEGVAI